MEYVVATMLGSYWNVSGDYIIMFMLSAFGFAFLGELIKKSIYPKLTKQESESNTQKECPKWLGLILGAIWTALFAITAIVADIANADRCQIVGGLYFFPITLVVYFAYQWAVMLLVKKIMRKLLPKFMTGEEKQKKDKAQEVVIVPKGTKVKKVDPSELD